MAGDTTMPTIAIGVNEQDRIKIADGLTLLLADFCTLYLQIPNPRWNVTGRSYANCTRNRPHITTSSNISRRCGCARAATLILSFA
jgi:hypothetical protein